MLSVVPTIDLIALDLDGTLLGPSDDISPANRRAIRSALEAGVRVVLVTGRGADTPIRIAHDLELNVPIVCCHGALTKDFLSNRTLGHIPVSLQYAKPMLEYAEQNGIDAAIYTEEFFYRLSGGNLYMDDMRGPVWREVPSFQDVLHAAPTFLRFFGRGAVEAIREAFGDLPVHFKYETWGDFEELAVTSIEATKKNALARLCDDFGIKAAHVMAVGDSRNDVPMMRWAGIGVAMGNALPEVKQAVKHVTASNDADGVALAIERFVLAPLEEEKTA
jgi:Cof subfamily protein (haloacid dehalogenase superfamily)